MVADVAATAGARRLPFRACQAGSVAVSFAQIANRIRRASCRCGLPVQIWDIGGRDCFTGIAGQNHQAHGNHPYIRTRASRVADGWTRTAARLINRQRASKLPSSGGVVGTLISKPTPVHHQKKSLCGSKLRSTEHYRRCVRPQQRGIHQYGRDRGALCRHGTNFRQVHESDPDGRFMKVALVPLAVVGSCTAPPEPVSPGRPATGPGGTRAE